MNFPSIRFVFLFPILKISAYPLAFISESAVLFVFLTFGRLLVMLTPLHWICWLFADLSVVQSRSIGWVGCWISGEWPSTGKRVKLS